MRFPALSKTTALCSKAQWRETDAIAISKIVRGLAGVELSLNDAFRIADIKIVFFFGPQTVAVSEYSGCFLSGHLDDIL